VQLATKGAVMTEEPQVADPCPSSNPDQQQESGPKQAGFWTDRRRVALIAALAVLLIEACVLAYYYSRYSRLIDHRLASGAFANTLHVFTAPKRVATGDTLSRDAVVALLRRGGFTADQKNPIGWYNLKPGAVEIFPGRDSYTGEEPTLLEFAGGRISRITSLQDNGERSTFELEPQRLANVSGQREKRYLIHYADIPPSVLHAVVSAEDKHFFQHAGFDILRMLKAAYIDMKEGRKEQGASTLTMQLARSFFLEPDKNWKRKFEELLITVELEDRLTKPEIFEDYVNQVYLGQRSTFSINGFGEAAHVYFGKEVSDLTNAEAALLAGMLQRPSYFNPYRNPERARERRDVVLGLMQQNGYLTDEEYRAAVLSPIKLGRGAAEGFENEYFVDLMNDELQERLAENGKQAAYVYTTLDPDLQRAAEDAVRMGMQLVDQQLRGRSVPVGQPQVSLIALDPHTGEIKALVGGRNYGVSQLNHALAMRQPGSAFKPFVYAAALETALTGGPQVLTPASVVDDSPTTFFYNGRTYEPDNFHHGFMGNVTLRTALAHSLNVATVEVAERVGYSKVVDLAHRAGLNEKIRPTPAVALGAYETTPLEIAGAYTMFANQGRRLRPTTIALARAADGGVLYRHEPDPQPVLDGRVAYLMTNMLEEVLHSGTGAGVRARGFTLPAAGKTGTSHDGWFAGFTSELLCVVWVGFDDNRELNLEGARSALPIWTEFMKRAATLREYRDAKHFRAPAGIRTVEICSDSGEVAGPYCPNVHNEVFIDGTQPIARCRLHVAPQQYVESDESNAPDGLATRKAQPATELPDAPPILPIPPKVSPPSLLQIPTPRPVVPKPDP
jgi:penicillin-binding protein 1B